MIKAYCLGLLTFVTIDTLWIKYFVLNFYTKSIPDILSIANQNLIAKKEPAILFYFIFYNCLFYFCIKTTSSLQESALNGALLGLMTYSTYALTNHTIMKQWSWSLSITDILWGSFICSVVSLVIYGSKN